MCSFATVAPFVSLGSHVLQILHTAEATWDSVCLILAVVPSSSLGSLVLPLYSQVVFGTKKCLLVSLVPSVIGSQCSPTPYALQQRALGLLVGLTVAVVPSVSLVSQALQLPLCYLGVYLGLF